MHPGTHLRYAWFPPTYVAFTRYDVTHLIRRFLSSHPSATRTILGIGGGRRYNRRVVRDNPFVNVSDISIPPLGATKVHGASPRVRGVK